MANITTTKGYTLKALGENLFQCTHQNGKELPSHLRDVLSKQTDGSFICAIERTPVYWAGAQS